MAKRHKSLSPQTLTTEAKADLDQLRELLGNHGSRQWDIGDCIVRLIDTHKLRLTDIAESLGRKKAVLSLYAKISRMYPAEKRQVELGFESHRLAAYAISRVERKERAITGETPEIDPVKAVTELVANRIRDNRPATAYIQQQVRERRQHKKAERVFPSDNELINRCHHGDCAALASRFDDNSLDGVHADPPYGAYRKHQDGRHDMNVRDISKLTECDNNTRQTAVATAIECIRAYAPKLKANKPLLLWQASTDLHWRIFQAAEESGLELDIMVIWDKTIPQPGDPASAWTPQCEVCYVFKKIGSTLSNHDESARGNIVAFNRIGQGEFHTFQKPDELNEFLILKHSDPQDLWVDTYGCSGSFCIAAHRLNRRWVYVESNEENYRWGASRVYEAVEESQMSAA